jgi:hypothetical protein
MRRHSLRTTNEFEDPSQPDDLDRLLYRMPGELPGSELADRICRQVGVRQRRAVQARLGLSILLAVFGAWMALPGVVNSLSGLSLPASGLSYLYPLIQSFLDGLWGFTQNALNGLAAFQANLAQAMGTGAWLGMVALAGAALLALSLVLPPIEE